MELVDFLIRNQLIALSFILFTILATLLYKRMKPWFIPRYLAVREGVPEEELEGVPEEELVSPTDVKADVKVRLGFAVALAALLSALVGGGLSLASLRPIPKAIDLDLDEGPLCSKPANRKLLAFIHGWNGDSNNTWRKFPTLACHDPKFSDVNILVVDYPTYMLRRNLHITELSDWLNNKLDAADQSQRYEKMAIVAHSLGGLIAREMVIIRELARKQVTFGLLISVASPYEGANIAKLGKALQIGQLFAEEARPGSSFLVTLGKHWALLRSRPRTYCYSGVGDAVVSNSSAVAKCDGFTTHPHHHWGHQDLVKPDDTNSTLSLRRWV